MAKKKKKSFFKKTLIVLFLIILFIGALGAYYAYKTFYQPNINSIYKKSQIIYIPTGSDFDDVLDILSDNNILKQQSTFEFLAEKKKYKDAIKPGKYRILVNMNNNELINLLRAGIQEPVELNFNGIKTTNQLISRLCRRIEADSMSLYRAMNDNGYLSKYGFNTRNIQSLFLPDTYEFVWNTSVDQFFDRMFKEYKTFWNDTRKKKARDNKFSQMEICILASIVQAEQCCDNAEKKIIAGLYINRLNQEMLLQSDPTVIFAIGDFSIQRVSFENTHFESPFNTYLNKGLPPGPIGFAQKSSIDAVLNYDKNNYIFMCAKDDLSGKHCFSKTYEQHCIFAKKYREALDKRNIH